MTTKEEYPLIIAHLCKIFLPFNFTCMFLFIYLFLLLLFICVFVYLLLFMFFLSFQFCLFLFLFFLKGDGLNYGRFGRGVLRLTHTTRLFYYEIVTIHMSLKI